VNGNVSLCFPKNGTLTEKSSDIIIFLLTRGSTALGKRKIFHSSQIVVNNSEI
jgi:hypothetical protein